MDRLRQSGIVPATVTVRIRAATFPIAWLGALAVYAVALCATPSRAAVPQRGAAVSEGSPISIAFEWERAPGAEDCAEGPFLRRAAEALLDKPVFVSSDRADIFIRGRIAPTANRRGYRAQLLLVAADGTAIGQREIQGETPDCASLNESLALVIALAADSLRAAPPVVLRMPKAPPRPGAPWNVELGVVSAAFVGLMPDVWPPAFGLRALLEPPVFLPFELSVLGWAFPDHHTTPDGRGADFRAIAFRAFLCPTLFAPGGTRVHGCLGAEFVPLIATGVAVDVPFTPASRIFGPSAKAAVSVPLWGKSALHLGAGLMMPLVRDRFYYRDEAGQAKVIHQPSLFVASGEIGISLRIP